MKPNFVNVVYHNKVPEAYDGLELYHYTDDADHPSDASVWKGIVMNGDIAVARSFGWAPTVICDKVDDKMVYTPYKESTILRFYRVNGVPMIGTHKRIDITRINSRIGNGRPFLDLVKDAIAGWEMHSYTYNLENAPDQTGLASTPTSWESLCMEGYCHVFLLVDKCNQITNLDPLIRHVDVVEAETDQVEGGEIISTYTPQLIYATSFVVDGELMQPYMKDLVWTVDDPTHTEHSWIVPRLPRLCAKQATELLQAGRCVVGFDPEHPERTTKFFSHKYASMVELAGCSMSVIHRWHQLMDEDNRKAEQYLSIIPTRHTMKSMMDINSRYLQESAEYLTNTILDRYYGINSPLQRDLYVKVSDIITSHLELLKSQYKKRPNRKSITDKTTSYVRDHLATLPYITQHTIHSKVYRAKIQCK